MRILFHDEGKPAEAAQRTEVLRKIDAWWDAFVHKHPDISALFAGKKDWDLVKWMEQNLQVIAPELMWEFGPGVMGGQHRLVITPESDHHLRGLVDLILQRKPIIVGWEFYPFRLAETVEIAAAAVKARTGGSFERVLAQVRLGEYGRIDMTFFSPRHIQKVISRQQT